LEKYDSFRYLLEEKMKEIDIKLVMNPRLPPMGWREFCKTSEPFSIALDGYVGRGPRFQAKGPRANFNHHEDVDRLATRATCSQIYIAIKQGLYKRFNHEGIPKVIPCMRDCDPDVAFSYALLKNGHRNRFINNKYIYKLVYFEDIIDTTAGAYPFSKDLLRMKQIAWIFEPYTNFCTSGEYDKKEPQAFKNIVYEIEDRIKLYAKEKGGAIPIDPRYTPVAAGKDWVVAHWTGAHPRTGIFADGYQVYAIYRELPNGRYKWSIGRMSIFIPFDTPLFMKKLNMIDEIIDSNDRWGGGKTIIGSPLEQGSQIAPAHRASLIRDIIMESVKQALRHDKINAKKN
jgi:hypothetical protein